MTPGEIAELYVSHAILKDACEYLLENRSNSVDAKLIILDARVLIQERLVAYMFSGGNDA